MTATIVACPRCGRKNRVPAAAASTPRCGNCRAPLPWIADADDTTFAEVAERSSVPVLVDLWAPWCGPCRFVGPILERLAGDYAGRVKLVKVNADEASQVSRRFAVQALPTLLLLRSGAVVARQIGAAAEPQLRAWFESGITTSEAAAG